jgi:type III pantothenate kinase
MAIYCLVIDVGNSSIKWAVADVTTPLSFDAVYRCERTAQALLDDLRRNAVDLLPVWMSSVAGSAFDRELIEALQREGWQHVVAEPAAAVECGLVNSYAAAETMGVDRWLAMLAARYQREGALLVVDVGTALTIDVVSADGRHEGGYILPGAQLMERSLTRDTQRVRFSDGAYQSLDPGQSTAQCVTSGLWLAAVGAVRLAMSNHPAHELVLAGGGGEALVTLGLKGEFRPHLVLEGLVIRALVALEA